MMETKKKAIGRFAKEKQGSDVVVIMMRLWMKVVVLRGDDGAEERNQMMDQAKAREFDRGPFHE